MTHIHFTYYSEKSPIKSFFRTKDDITTKIYLARLLARNTEWYFPPTMIYEKGELNYLNENNEYLYTGITKEYNIEDEGEDDRHISNLCEFDEEEGEDDRHISNLCEFDEDEGEDDRHISNLEEEMCLSSSPSNNKTAIVKWFLKPSKGYGGTGIRILDDPHKAEEFFRKKTVGYPKEIFKLDPRLSRNMKAEYVLQRGVDNPLLLHGYKFDMRVWVLFSFHNKKRFNVYLYDDAFLRVSSKLYDSESVNPMINLTNLTFHQKQKSTISKTYTMKKQPFYEEVYPKILDATRDVVNRLKKSIVAGPQKGYEILGFDYIIDESLRPFLLEINRHIGYPVGARNKSVVNLIYKMMRDVVKLAIEPKITGDKNPDKGGWVTVTTFEL
jgi:hypothetical protein